jgi:hypothetical protein
MAGGCSSVRHRSVGHVGLGETFRSPWPPLAIRWCSQAIFSRNLSGMTTSGLWPCVKTLAGIVPPSEIWRPSIVEKLLSQFWKLQMSPIMASMIFHKGYEIIKYWVLSMGVWQGVAKDYLKYEPGPPCPTLLLPTSMPHSHFRGSLPEGRAACGHLLPLRTSHAISLWYRGKIFCSHEYLNWTFWSTMSQQLILEWNEMNELQLLVTLEFRVCQDIPWAIITGPTGCRAWFALGRPWKQPPRHEAFLGSKKRLYKSLRWLVGWLVGWLVRWSVGPLVRCSVCPHNEILQNLLTSKTGYVAIASRLGFGVTSLFYPSVAVFKPLLLCLWSLRILWVMVHAMRYSDLNLELEFLANGIFPT